MAQRFYALAEIQRKLAGRYIQLAWIGIVLGVILVLALPAVVDWIDREFSSFELIDEIRTIEETRLELAGLLLENTLQTNDVISRAREIYDNPYAVWRIDQHGSWRSDNISFEIIGIEMRGSQIVAFGNYGPGGRTGENDETASSFALILHKAASGLWLRATILDEEGIVNLPGFVSNVAFGNGMWVATVSSYHVSESGNPVRSYMVLTSVDGQEWLVDEDLRYAACGGGDPSYWHKISYVGGTWVAICDRDDGSYIASSNDLETWTDSGYVVSPTGELIDILINDIERSPNGTWIAVGSAVNVPGSFREAHVILRSEDFGTWHVIAHPDPLHGGRQKYGWLANIDFNEQDGWLAVGSVELLWTDESDTIRSNFDEQSSNERITVEHPLILKSNDDGLTWKRFREEEGDYVPATGWLEDIELMPNGNFLAVGPVQGREIERHTLGTHLFSQDGHKWDQLLLTGMELTGGETIRTIASVDNGNATIGGVNIIATAVLDQKLPREFSVPDLSGEPEDVEAEVEKGKAELNQLISMLQGHQFIVPHSLNSLSLELQTILEEWESRGGLLTQSMSTLETTTNALSDADMWQRIGRVATRIAVIALLVFLLQIVVNLYRYSTRLSGYYRARGDAIVLMKAAADGQPNGLTGLNLPDVINALSPDSVAFDKAPPSPTQHIADVASKATT